MKYLFYILSLSLLLFTTYRETQVQSGRNQTPADFSVLVQGKEFRCSRDILREKSGYFQCLFSSGMTETNQNSVTLENMSSNVFDDVYRWMVTGNSVLATDKVFDVLMATDFLLIENLMDDCEKFISQNKLDPSLSANISSENYVVLYRLSRNFCCEGLKQSMDFIFRDFFLENFDEMSASEAFYELSVEELKSLVADCQLKTLSEDLVVESILRWSESYTEKEPKYGSESYTEKEPKYVSESYTQIESQTPTERTISVSGNDGTSDRRSDTILSSLLRSTRYLLVSSYCLWNTLSLHPLVQADEECLEILEEIKRYKTCLDIHQHTCLSAAMQRRPTQIRDVILTCSGGAILYQNLVSSQSWKDFGLFCPQPDANSMAYYDGSVYVQGENKRLWVLKPKEKEWEVVTENASSCSKSNVRTIAMLPIENELVSVYEDGSKTYIIERLSLQFFARRGQSWATAGELSPGRGMEVVAVTNIGRRLIIFWEEPGQQYFRIQCFDLYNRKSLPVADHLQRCLGSDSCLVTFKHEDEAFVLQGNGSLWRVTAVQRNGFLSVTYEMPLWSGLNSVRGAMIVLDQLWVFGEEFQAKVDEDNQHLDGVFKKVTFCQSQNSKTGYIHAVLPRVAFK